MAGLASKLAAGTALAIAVAAAAAAQAPTAATDWRSSNYNNTANRYSPLDQITPANVTQLERAWSFHMKPAGYTGRLREDEAIPLVIGNTMYLGSPYGAIHALDATTGAERWKFQLPNND
jgi:quinoprotein glucose dehydrogenase